MATVDVALKDRLQGHLAEVARERDPYFAAAGHLYVETYVHQQLEQWGTVTAHRFRANGREHRNWVLDLPGRDPGRSPILVGAHYDGVPGSPSADDNATGVAALLEIARAIAHRPARHPVRCVAFDLEEMGLVGSEQYATALHEQKVALRLMISLEMLGYCDRAPGSQRYPSILDRFYPSQGDFIGLIGNLVALGDLLHFHRAMQRVGARSEWLPAGRRGLMVPQTRQSDHAPFWDRGYRALMVTDTAFLRNPHYHQPSDRLETLDLDFLTLVCQGMILGLQTL